ncbi:MAG: acetoacetate decarboxylase family protein [Deltaproteobacteria bacterium]|nr:acetoacetate decarboxylase family protein [Candidatus Zymogenaceae bacterium]
MRDGTTGPIRKSETFWGKIRDKKRKGENTWDNARFVLADVPLDYHEVKRILPWAMRPSNPPMATLFIAHYTGVSFPLFPYHEAALLIHVRTPLGTGIHCCWMIVDDDTALILGRELLGYPKKMGVFKFNEEKDTVRASVSRRGTQVISIEGIRAPKETAPQPVFNCKTFNIGGMGQFFAVNPVWMFRPREVIHEYYRADIKLTLNDSDYDPISRLVAGEPQNGRIVVMDIPGDSSYMVPVGLAGPKWFSNTFNLRFR